MKLQLKYNNNMAKIYFRLNYFYSRKDSGSKFVSFTQEEFDNFSAVLIDTDDVIEEALKLKKITTEEAEHTVDVERLEEDEVKELELEKRGV